MEPLRLAALLAGAFFLVFGLALYRQFYRVLGVMAGLVLWSALRESIVQLPGLRQQPGTTATLALILFCALGVLLVTKFHKVLAFAGGFGIGVILSKAAGSFFTGAPLLAKDYPFPQPGPMDLLAGLVAGVLFLLFERFFAILLTSSLGGFLCAWAIGGRWTLPVGFLFGLVAQPIILARFGTPGGGERESRSRGKER